MSNLTLTSPLHTGQTVEAHVAIEDAAEGSKDSWQFGSAAGAPVEVYEVNGTLAGLGRLLPDRDYRFGDQQRYVLAGGAKARQRPGNQLGVVLLTTAEVAEEAE
jgi:hypothetical protein